MAMLHQPKIVFLDEPTIGLDVIAKQRIRAFIREMNRKGTTFILTTHDLEDVEQLAQKVIIINHGQKVFDDTLMKLRLNLGAKKIIHLQLARPVQSFDLEDSADEKHSELEYTLEVNLRRTPSTSSGSFQRCVNSRTFPSKSFRWKIITSIYESED